MKRVLLLLAQPALIFWSMAMITGCSTVKDVNPPVPQPKTGYVDFYSDFESALSWEVKRAGAESRELVVVYSEFEPLKDNVLRLAAPPGRYRYQLQLVNQCSEAPETVEVTVLDSKVTPVRLTLTPTGQRRVSQEAYGYHSSARGYNRGVKSTSRLDEVYKVGASAEAVRVYEIKERMPYFHSCK